MCCHNLHSIAGWTVHQVEWGRGFTFGSSGQLIAAWLGRKQKVSVNRSRWAFFVTHKISGKNHVSHNWCHHVPICYSIELVRTEQEKVLVHAFVNSKLDYCNSLAYGLPKYLLQKLQYVQNAAARLITGIRKHDHITPILMDLHWLPVNQRIQFKILLLTFKSLNGLAPVYIDEMIQRYVPNRKLRSSSAFLLKQNKWNLKSYGFRTFTVAAPFLWNSLPLEVKSSPSLNIFKSKLKTHLFKCAFNLN